MSITRKYILFSIFIIFDWTFSRLSGFKRRYLAHYGPFYVLNNSEIVLNGGLGSSVFSHVKMLLKNYPDVSSLLIERCPGSSDDQELIKAGILINETNIHIHVPSGAKVCSGGVDLFLAGTQRTMGKGAKLGVHAWSDDETGLSANDISIDDHEHQMYIDYYAAIGWSQIEARKLYRFIICSAPPNKTYYLTERDIAEYNILTS